MLTLSHILFTLLCLAVSWIAKTRATRPIASSAEYMVISLSLLSAAIASMGELLLDSTGSDSGTLQRMFTNLAIYTGAPMLVTALVALARAYPISRPAWGRWLLGLIAFFEFCRRMGYGEQYTLVMALCLIAASLLSVIWFKSNRVRALILAATLSFTAAIIAHYEATLALALLLGCAGVVLLGMSILQLPHTAEAEDKKAEG